MPIQTALVRGQGGHDHSIEASVRIVRGQRDKLLQVAGIVFGGEPEGIIALIRRRLPQSGKYGSAGWDEPDQIALGETK